MKLSNIFIAAIFVLSVSSCTNDLEKTNINPNESEVAQPDYLLSNVIKSTADNYWGTTNNLDGTLLFIQHVAKIQYTDVDRYIFNNSSFQSPWDGFYSGSLTDLSKIIALGESSGNNNYKGVALVLRSWVFLLLTDTYGDIPYSQATNIDKYITPAYDTQKDVYHGLLADLKTAAGLIDPNGLAINGDLLYSGDLNKWIKFANSLRYRIALRIADREPTVAGDAIAEIPTDKLIGDGETAQLNYLSSPNENPIALFFETRDDYRVSKSIVETLRGLNDPRLPVYANKTETATPQQYVGVPNGLLTTDASNLGFAKTSKLGTYFTTAQTPAVILTPAEVLFDRAEAAARGFTTEDPQSLYNQAIIASFKQFGITDNTVINNYLSQQTVAYDPSNFRKSIGNQKWIALFGQGLEAFAEWRRLDYPILTPAVAGVLGGKFPLRYIYPGNEQSLNLKNYQAAVADQGPDILTTKLWFDVY